MRLPSSMADFVPRDRKLQKAYYYAVLALKKVFPCMNKRIKGFEKEDDIFCVFVCSVFLCILNLSKVLPGVIVDLIFFQV